MLTSSLTHVRDLLHAQLCYQMFITPIFLPLDKPYRDFARRGCEYIAAKRTDVIHQELPRHHVLHRFTPQRNKNHKKVLIAHGWISRAAYMARLINVLYQQGYEVYALDFPAHGEAKGLQLPWTDAVAILRNTINEYGPFYAVIGHSFGGAMLLNTLNIAGQHPDWQLKQQPECAILIAAPTHMRSPVNRLAKKFKLSGHGYLQLRQLIRQQAQFDLKMIRLNHFIAQTSDVAFLCIHGEQDQTVSLNESVEFCTRYPAATLCVLPEATHISVLLDARVEQLVSNFLARKTGTI